MTATARVRIPSVKLLSVSPLKESHTTYVGRFVWPSRSASSLMRTDKRSIWFFVTTVVEPRRLAADVGHLLQPALDALKRHVGAPRPACGPEPKSVFELRSHRACQLAIDRPRHDAGGVDHRRRAEAKFRRNRVLQGRRFSSGAPCRTQGSARVVRG